MQILHWEFSEKFAEYLEWFRSTCQKKIDYRYIDEHHNPSFHIGQGETEIYQGRIQVYLNRAAPADLAEETAAHELTHVALLEQGYAAVDLRNRHQREWQSIAVALQSWVSDVLIDRKLLNFGYTNRAYYDLIYESTRENLINFPNPSLNRLDQIGNSLGYFYCHFSLPEDKWEDLRQVYREIDPPVVELGEEMVRLGETMGFLGTTSYLRFMVALRDHLNLGGVIAIVDPLGKKTY